jgi:hypothetical protein
MIQVHESNFCILQPLIVLLAVPPKPDQSEMPISSIGRSGSGAEKAWVLLYLISIKSYYML